jgi:hypothetical protein
MDKTLVCGTDAAGSIPAGSTEKRVRFLNLTLFYFLPQNEIHHGMLGHYATNGN